MSKASRSTIRWRFRGCRRLAGLVAAFTFAGALQAAAVSTSRSFNLPADVAENSLNKFAEQSGLEVVFATDTAGKVRTNAVKGDYTSREAMDRLLSGTGLVAAENPKTGALLVSHEPNGQSAAQTTPSGRSPDAQKKNETKNR